MQTDTRGARLLNISLAEEHCFYPTKGTTGSILNNILMDTSFSVLSIDFIQFPIIDNSLIYLYTSKIKSIYITNYPLR